MDVRQLPQAIVVAPDVTTSSTMSTCLFAAGMCLPFRLKESFTLSWRSHRVRLVWLAENAVRSIALVSTGMPVTSLMPRAMSSL